MLLTLLMVLTSVTFFASAVITAKHERATLAGYLLAIVIGLLLAACNAWVVYKAGDLMAMLTSSSSKVRQDWVGRLFFLAIMVWLPLAAFLGNFVASTLMRFAS
jgi:hypothetical protein